MTHCAAAAVCGLNLFPTATSRASPYHRSPARSPDHPPFELYHTMPRGFGKCDNDYNLACFQTREDSTLLPPATSAVPAGVARHMTGLESDSSNFSGSLTSLIYLEQPRTFADCCLASACNLRLCPKTIKPRCAWTRLCNGQKASWKGSCDDSGLRDDNLALPWMFDVALHDSYRCVAAKCPSRSNVRHFSQYCPVNDWHMIVWPHVRSLHLL